MKNNMFAIVFLSLYFSIIPAVKSYASFSDNEYLWVELSERIKETNGSLTQLMHICYGGFPDRKNSISGLEGLRGFYTLKEKDKSGKDIFYPVNIEKEKESALIRVNSLKTNHFTVLVEGEKNLGKVKNCYLAKASFVLFGHSSAKRSEIKSFPYDDINSCFEICIVQKHSYWPETGEPVKITPSFDDLPLAGKKIHIFDENGDYINIMTGKNGDYIYMPLEDKQLNLKCEASYKQTVIAAEEIRGNTNYKSSYTLLLHRSRFGNKNLLFGSSVFVGTMAGVFIVVVARRRSFPA